MTKFVGKGMMQTYSQEISMSESVTVQSLPALLNIPKDLSKNLIVVRGNKKLDSDNLISNNDEIFLFLAVMGG